MGKIPISLNRKNNHAIKKNLADLIFFFRDCIAERKMRITAIIPIIIAYLELVETLHIKTEGIIVKERKAIITKREYNNG